MRIRFENGITPLAEILSESVRFARLVRRFREYLRPQMRQILLATLASVGLPGLAGFVAEFLVLAGLFAVDPWIAAVAALAAISVAVTESTTVAAAATVTATGSTTVAAAATVSAAGSTTGTATVAATTTAGAATAVTATTAGATPAVTTTVAATVAAASATALGQNQVTFEQKILDIGDRRCWISGAVTGYPVRRNRAPGRKCHETP